MKKELLVSAGWIERIIYIIRGEKVMLDRDLALLYCVATKNLNKAVDRNRERFPKDFMFQLSKYELQNWKFQTGTSNVAIKMGLRRCPYAFTEQGVAMLSSVLRSPRAIAINIEIMRAFVQLRHFLASQKKTDQKLAAIKSFVLKHSHKTDQEFCKVWRAIEKLSNPLPPANQRRIGFQLN